MPSDENNFWKKELNTEEEEPKKFSFDWEVLIDAAVKLNDNKEIIVFFSRVYVEDLDLLNLEEKNKKIKEENLAEKLEELSIETINCQKFLTNIEKLGFVSGFKKMPNFSSTSTNRLIYAKSDLETIDDVNFTTYISNFKNNHFASYKLQNIGKTKKRKSNKVISSDEDSDKKSCSLSSSSSFETKNLSPLNTSQSKSKFNFDFGFNPERDAKLIAKDANKKMKGDYEIMKYWYQRHRLFSKFQDGVLMDREGWFSVTPERLAQHTAERIVTKKNMIILDAFTGVGGNAIQFAIGGAYVYALDLDPVKIRCAAHNARIYGVSDRITFICVDFFNFAKSLKSHSNVITEDENSNLYGINAVFLSPPWGGPAYAKSQKFDLEHDLGLNGIEIFRAAKNISPNICYYLPRNTSIKQIIGLVRPKGKVEVEQNLLNGKVKTISAYFGKLIAS